MTRTVLSVAYPFAVVGPAAVGGAEVVLTSVERELVARGWGSVVVAKEGSVCSGRLVGTAVPEGTISDELREEVVRRHQMSIDRALRTERIDLMHMHGIDFDRYRVPEGLPVVVTLHLPPSWYSERIWRLPENYQLLCVSETQRQACPKEMRERLHVVENGVELPEMGRMAPRRKYALMLSRICPEKNLHAGIEAARAAGVPVMLAGEVFPYAEHQRYFREEIEPRLGEGARFVGAVGGAEKMRLLAKARCLLLPTLAPETSSLVAMEAMAEGTPVVAFRSGALPELVEEGRTGFLVEDVAGMAAAIERVSELDREVCRSVAAERFTVERMMRGYLHHYEAMCERWPLPGKAEVAAPGGTLTCSVLQTTGELEEVREEWGVLLEKDQRATPFQSPEWLLSWWRCLGEGDLFVVLARGEDGALRGMLPMYLYRQPASGSVELMLLGAGTSDYLDGLFAGTGAEAERIAAAMLEKVREQRGDWDRVFLHQLRPGSPLLVWAKKEGLKLWESESCAVVAVQGRMGLPAKLRLNSGRYVRRAESRGALVSATAQTEAEATEGFEELLRLHGLRWPTGGVLEPATVRAQHRECVPELLRAGLLRMLSVRLSGRTIAVLYALVDPPSRPERRMYAYLMGFDPEFGELSPGTLVVSYAFDTCVLEGLRFMDLLRGGEEYKRFWGAVEQPTFGFDVPRSGERLPEKSYSGQ